MSRQRFGGSEEPRLVLPVRDNHRSRNITTRSLCPRKQLWPELRGAIVIRVENHQEGACCHESTHSEVYDAGKFIPLLERSLRAANRSMNTDVEAGVNLSDDASHQYGEGILLTRTFDDASDLHAVYDRPTICSGATPPPFDAPDDGSGLS